MKKLLPVYYQIEAKECGFTSIAMILAYYGCPSTLSELRSRTVIGHGGLSVNDLINILATNKIIATPYLLKTEEVKNMTLPAILHWDLNHYVVIKKCNKYRITVHDPKHGACHMSWKVFKRKFGGLALNCVPSRDFIALGGKPGFIKYWNALLFRQNKKIYLILCVLLFLNQFLLLSGLLFFSNIFSSILKGSVIAALSVFGVFTLLLNTLLYLLSICKNKLQAISAYRQRKEFARNLGGLSIDKLHSLSFPMVNREFLITKNYSNNFIPVIFDIAWYLSASLSCLIIMFINHFNAGLAVLFFSVLMSLIYLFYLKNYEIYNAEKTSNDNQLSILLSDMYFGLKSILIFNKKNSFLKHWGSSSYKASQLSLKLQKNQNLFQLLNEFMYQAEFIVLLIIIYAASVNKSYLMGEFYVLFLCRQIYSRSFSRLLDKWTEFTELFKFYPYMSFERLSSSADDNIDVLPRRSFPLFFELKIVDLSYYSGIAGSCLFKNVSLSIYQKDFTVITGSSGCGKSTFMQILSGLLPASNGSVMLGSTHITHYKHYISAVLQNDRFFYGTIIENLTFFECSTVNDAMVSLCEALGMYDAIMQLPYQFATYISNDHMAGLSGGQLQRLLIIRALYTNPKVLFLDEATSQLDPEAELLVIRAIKSRVMTCIAISHRLQTISQADRVIDFNLLSASARSN